MHQTRRDVQPNVRDRIRTSVASRSGQDRQLIPAPGFNVWLPSARGLDESARRRPHKPSRTRRACACTHDARLLPAAFHHALQRLEAMKSYCRRRRSDAQCLRIFAPSGISIDGVRHVTGGLDPAIIAKPMRRDVSCISFAPSSTRVLVIEQRHGATLSW